MSAAVTYEELEYRTHVVRAKATKASIDLSKRRVPLIPLIGLIWDLKRLEVDFALLLKDMHSASSAQRRLLENASKEERAELAALMEPTPDRVRSVVARIRKLPASSYCEPTLLTLERQAEELEAHVRALSDETSTPIMLSKLDQKNIVTALLSDQEPSDDLKAAFARHSRQ